MRIHSDEDLSNSERLIVKVLDNALKKLPRSKDTIVFRKISIPFIGGKSDQDKAKRQEFLTRYSEDKVVMENQFTSTSKNRRHVEGRDGNITFIYKQTSGREIMPFSYHPEESEILIPRKKYFTVEKVWQVNGLMYIRIREGG